MDYAGQRQETTSPVAGVLSLVIEKDAPLYPSADALKAHRFREIVMGVRKEKPIKQARRFLDNGQIDGVDVIWLAAECDQIVRRETEKSSARAIELGQAFVRRARLHGGVLLQTAYRASGWAFLVGGKFAQAKKAYLKARDLVKRDPMLRARIDRILIDVYMYLGNVKEARRRARLSLATFGKLGADDELAKTRVNYANLLHRQDRHREAQKLYHEAGKHFEAKADRVATAFCYYNEANTLVQLFDFDTASALYREAADVFKQYGHDLRANGCRYGLAWLYMLEGNYHIALKELAGCEADYQKASQWREVVLCQLDRAEAYLGLNLFVDAKRSAQDAEKSARKLGIRYESAKAALFLAKACMAMGRTADARRALKRAEAGFAQEKNQAFLAAVELARVQMENGSIAYPTRNRTARKRFSKAQLPLWEAICDLQVLSEWPDNHEVLRRLAKNLAVNTVPHLYARWHTMLGDRQAKRGHLDAAVACWERACDVLDAVRAKLPPVDMRTAFLSNQGDPHCRLIEAELRRNPVSAAAWSERYKTAGLWQTDDQTLLSNPVRGKAEKSLSELASQVTALSGRIEGAGGKRAGVSVRANEAFYTLQEKVRHDLAAIGSSAKAKVDRIETVCQQILYAASRQPVIQFHSGSSDLVAFVHYKNQTRFYRYLDGARIAREFMGRWRFLVERAASLMGSHSTAELRDEQQLLEQIGEWLLSPLEISAGHQRLLILPEGDVTNLPWQAIIYRGFPLAGNHELLLSPSLRHYLHARSQRTRSRKVEVFVGSTEELSHIEKEYDFLSRAGNGEVVIHNPCFRDDWPHLTQARLWHYAGHAQLRRDNPFYSSLLVADGPMFAADFRLKRNKVGLVTLAACRTGQQAFLPGQESTGLVRSLLEMGARSVLASQWAVSDHSTSLWMNEFYKRFLSGKPVASAVRKTALSIQNKYPSAYHWAAFSVFGAG
jgi:tetratricopeptide (TPR) repeat protein